MTRGQIREETRLERSKTFTTRYVMFLRWSSQVDPIFEDIYIYDISVMDVRSGSEVLTLSGNGYESKIVKKLMEALQKK